MPNYRTNVHHKTQFYVYLHNNGIDCRCSCLASNSF